MACCSNHGYKAGSPCRAGLSRRARLQYFARHCMSVSKHHSPPLPATTKQDRILYNKALSYFIDPRDDGLIPIEKMLSGNIRENNYRAALIIQAANTVLDEEARQTSKIIEDKGGAIQCSRGCTGCCNQAVVSDPFEDILIWLFLEANDDPLQFFSHAYPIWKNNTVSTQQSFFMWAEQYYKNGIDTGRHQLLDYYEPCPFLRDGLCQIYPVRPYGCRAYLAVSAQCHTPVLPGDRPGMKGMDFGSFTNHKKARATMINLLYRIFGMSRAHTKMRFMPDSIHDILLTEHLNVI